MFRWTWLAIVASGLVIAPDLPAAEPIKMAPDWVRYVNFLSIRLVGGRILVENFDTAADVNVLRPVDRHQERLQMTYRGTRVTLHYEHSSPAGTLSYNVVNSDDVTVRWQPAGAENGPAVVLLQPAYGPVQCEIGAAEAKFSATAPTLWHLFLAHPQESRAQLIPLVEIIRPQWDIPAKLAELETALARSLPTRSAYSREEIVRWVQELSSDRFSERRAAEKKLVDAGQQIVARLRRLDPDELDAEQRYRLRAICQDMLAQEGEDDAVRMVSLLVDDPELWLSLMQRPEERWRQLAAERLARLLGQKLEFDPNAEAAQRSEQLRRIQAIVAGAADKRADD